MIEEFTIYGSTYQCIRYLDQPHRHFEVIRCLLYCIWTFISFVSPILFFKYDIKDIYNNMTPFIIHSINCAYLYELFYHPPGDIPHKVHHIVTIIVQCLTYYSGWLHLSPCHIIICNTAHQGFFSSILSSLRTLAKKYKWTDAEFINKCYFYSYLIAKTWWYICLLYIIVLLSQKYTVFRL